MIQEKQNQKKVDYKEMSTKKCKECGMPLKQNVVLRNPHACLCYVCFKVASSKFKSIKHKWVNGEKVRVKTIDFKELQIENKRRYLH